MFFYKTGEEKLCKNNKGIAEGILVYFSQDSINDRPDSTIIDINTGERQKYPVEWILNNNEEIANWQLKIEQEFKSQQSGNEPDP